MSLNHYSSLDGFWNDVSTDHEALAHTASVVKGKVKVAGYWPFLAGAINPDDFENRLSIVSNKINSAVDDSVREEVVASLRDDYRLLYEASLSAEAQHVQVTDRNDGMYLVDHVLNPKQSQRLHQGKDKDEALETARKFGGYNNLPVYVNDHLDNEKTATLTNDDQPSNERVFWHEASQKWVAYIDPSDAERYNHYPKIEPLQLGVGEGSVDFPEDLAQGEDRATEAIQRQITPGTWTAHDGMPERPMPFSMERGYVPVNGAPSNGSAAQPSLGGNAYYEASVHQAAPSASDHYSNGYSHGLDPSNSYPSPTFQDGYERSHGEDAIVHYLDGHNDARTELDSRRNRTAAVNDDGVSYADPILGYPQKQNQYYFDQGSVGLESDANFPEDPWNGPVEDRANEYGDVAPQNSSGSTEGTSDGKGYSNQNGQATASRPNFKQAEAPRNRYGPKQFATVTADDEDVDAKSYLHKGDKVEVLHHNPDEEPVSVVMHPHDNTEHRIDPSKLKIEATRTSWVPLQGPNDKFPTAIATQRADGTWSVGSQRQSSYTDRDDPKNAWSRGHYDASNDRGYGEDQHEDPEHPRVKAYSEGYNEGLKSKVSKKNTDGKIVGMCKNCNGPLRVHKTSDGDELHHLHNDSFNCHTSSILSDVTNIPDSPPLSSHLPTSGGGVDMGEAEEAAPEIAALASQQFFDPHDASVRIIADSMDTTPNVTNSDPSLSSSQDDLSEPNTPQDQLDQITSMILKIADDYITRPDSSNPTGRGEDEYRARTWDGYASTRPFQSGEERNINTPVKAADPIKTMDTDHNTTVEQTRPEDQDEDE